MLRSIIVASALALPMSVMANDLPNTAYLPMDMALKAATTAINVCADKGYQVSAVVVARDGNTKVALKADNSGPHTMASATGKAFTSAAMGQKTGALAEFITAKPANNGLRDMDSRMVIQEGGVPIKFDKTLVAGIGVGGAPSGAIDAECAVAGLQAIGANID